MNVRVFAFLVTVGLGLQATGVMTFQQVGPNPASGPFIMTGALAVVLALGYAAASCWPRWPRPG